MWIEVCSLKISLSMYSRDSFDVFDDARIRENEVLETSLEFCELRDGQEKGFHATMIRCWREADKPLFLSFRTFSDFSTLVMTNKPSVRVAGTMETIQWYEKAGLHCWTNHRQDSSFSPLYIHSNPYISYHMPSLSLFFPLDAFYPP